MGSAQASFIIPALDPERIETLTRQIGERFDDVEVIPVYGAQSFFDAWRQGVEAARFPYLILTHEDTEFAGLPDFEPYFADPTVGMIGVAGSRALRESGPWWFLPEREILGELSGQLRHRVDDVEKVTTFGPFGDVVVLDGVCLVTTKERLAAIGGIPDKDYITWDFYDHVLSLEFIRHGYRLLTAPIDVTHFSGGLDKRASYYTAAAQFEQEYLADPSVYYVAKRT